MNDDRAVDRRDPIADLRRIALLLEQANEASYRVRAFRSAAAALADLHPGELFRRATGNSLTELPGVGAVTAQCVVESLAGTEPESLSRRRARVDAEGGPDGRAGGGGNPSPPVARLRAALRGDCHSHSDWSDGGAPIEEMALAAVELGHEYLVLTDHSPRLTVARGLSADRLRQQIDRVARINAALPDGFRLLTGIEVDIMPDGSLDQEDDLLASLDVVVASVHSRLRDPEKAMTERMLAAIANPNVDILGHCTGRRLPPGKGTGRRARTDQGGDRGHRRDSGRPESSFDAAAVFAACVTHDTAVEINCRPDRLDPPLRLLRQAAAAGCHFAIDTDAHAPGQLAWQRAGCERAAACDIAPDHVVNTLPAKALLDWTRSHG